MLGLVQLEELESDIKAICQPLSEKNISFFSYLRYYNDGTVSLLSTSTQLYEHFFKQSYQLTTPIPASLLKQDMHYLVLPEGSYQQAMHDTHNILNTESMIDLLHFGENYYDMFCYSGSVSNNHLLSMLDELQLFTHYFKEKAHIMIEKVRRSKISLPQAMRVSLLDDYGKANSNVDMSAELSVDYYRYEINSREIRITPREMQCWVLLAAGYGYKQIAKQLNLSARTVETHLAKIKIKLGVSRKIDLVKIIHQLPNHVAMLRKILVLS